MTVWDQLSARYDTLWVQKYSLRPSRQAIVAHLAHRTAAFSLLDVGCGTGQLLCELKAGHPAAALYGIDQSPRMIAAAREKNSTIDYRCVSVQEFATERTFDILTCCHSFPYYKEQAQVLRQLSMLLQEDGEAIFIQASINSRYDKWVMSVVEKTAEKANYLSKQAFCRLAASYFVVKETYTIKERWFMPTICVFVLGKKR
ncbi:MAG: class I SAM-dependent methyltransferase [Eubacteriales bacterium]